MSFGKFLQFGMPFFHMFFCFSNSCLFVLVLKNPKVGFSSRHVMIMTSAPIADAKDTAFLNALLLPDVPLYGTKIRSKFFVKFVLCVQRRILIITYFYFLILKNVSDLPRILANFSHARLLESKLIPRQYIFEMSLESHLDLVFRSSLLFFLLQTLPVLEHLDHILY